MQLELTAEEQEVLDDLLSRSISGLREEVYKAEVAEFKAGLQKREALLTSLLDRVRALRSV